MLSIKVCKYYAALRQTRRCSGSPTPQTNKNDIPDTMAKKSIVPVRATCDTCGKESDYLNEHNNMNLCSSCLADEYIREGREERKLEVRKAKDAQAEKNLNIAKTLRAVAGNREVTINEFTDGRITIATTRYVSCPCEHGLGYVPETTHYTLETLCLVAEAIDKALLEFNIDRASVLERLKGESDIHQTFHDFKRIVTRQEEQ